MEPFYQEPMATIYCGDALEVLKELPDESAQMVMTSPPYWGLRNYAGGTDIVWGSDNHCQHQWVESTQGLQHGNRNNLIGTQEKVVGKTGTAFIQKYDRLPAGFCSLCDAWSGQLGLEPTPELYVEHLMMIFQEVKRALKKDGSFYLNIGDTYVTGKGSCYNPGGGSKSWQSQTSNKDKYPIGQAAPNRMCTSIFPGCMACIPERVMFAMIEDGWRLRNKIIWHKPNSMPQSVKSRFTTSWEYLYLFTKNNKTILWRNHKTGEWRDTKPTKEENYPYGMHDEEGNKRQPLWMGFSYYFELDAVRKPHKTLSLERYQRGVNLGRPAEGKSGEVGPMQQYERAPQWFKDMYPPDSDYKGKFDELFGHGPNPQSFNLRVRDVKRGKRGTSAQSGELKASEKEIEEYEYPEKHHGSSISNQASLHKDRAFQSKKEPYLINNPHTMRLKKDKYIALNPEQPNDLSHPKGKNPGDFWSITTKPSSISVCPQCDAVFPRLIKVCPNCKIEGVVGHFAPYPETLCIDPIKASSREGDVILDMFAGGGSTGIAAKRLGRRTILIDCVRPYCVMAKYKLSRVEYQPELV